MRGLQRPQNVDVSHLERSPVLLTSILIIYTYAVHSDAKFGVYIADG